MYSIFLDRLLLLSKRWPYRCMILSKPWTDGVMCGLSRATKQQLIPVIYSYVCGQQLRSSVSEKL